MIVTQGPKNLSSQPRLVPPGMRASQPIEPAEMPAPADDYCPEREGGCPTAIFLLGAASLAALSSVSQAQTPTYDGVVIFDDFVEADVRSTHGLLVQKEESGQGPDCEAVPTSAQRQVTIDVPFDPIKNQEADGLEQYVRNHFLIRLNNTSEALRAEAARGVRLVINQSQGASESRVFQVLAGAARNPEHRPYLASQLGLEENPDNKELLGALLEEVARVHRHDPAVQAAERELAEASALADEQGIIRIVSAGNHGLLHRHLVRLVLEPDAEFHRNALATESSIIVGAADDKGTPDPSDDEVSYQASPMAGAHLSADGVQRELCVHGQVGKHDGSSYAAPQVSDRVDEMLLEDPTITRDQVLETLVSEVTPRPGDETYLGAGIYRRRD